MTELSRSGDTRVRLDALRDRVRATWNAAPIVSAIGGFGFMLWLEIPWLPHPVNDSEATRTTVVAAILLVVVTQNAEIQRKLSPPATGARKHLRDPVDVYSFITPIMAKIERSDDKHIDILAATLYGVWPVLLTWLDRPEAAGWQVRAAGFRDADRRLAPWIPDDWYDEAKVNIGNARSVAASDRVRRRGIDLKVYEYDFLPVVRGLRLGNGDLIIALMAWEDDGQAAQTSIDYEYIPHDEDTPSAEHLRSFFNSWFERACTGPPAGNPSNGQAGVPSAPPSGGRQATSR